MKPREFDDLIRQKFDQNDFAYNPRNWEQLAEQMDGRAKKRSIMLWWLMPLAGVAASVALAMGVAPVMQQGIRSTSTEMAQTRTIISSGAQSLHTVIEPAAPVSAPTRQVVVAYKRQHQTLVVRQEPEEEVHISFLNAVPAIKDNHKVAINLLDENVKAIKKFDKKKTEPEAVVTTFKSQVTEKAPKMSIIVGGGYSQGMVSNGYVAGATVRRMISGKVFVESDVNFASSNDIQAITSVHSHSVAITSASRGDGLPGSGYYPGLAPLTGTTVQGSPIGGYPGSMTGGSGGYGVSAGAYAGARMNGSGNNAPSGGADPKIGNSNTGVHVSNAATVQNRVPVTRSTTVTHNNTGAKITSTTGGTDNNNTTQGWKMVPDGQTTNNVLYNMNYVQFSPSIGVNITKKISVGAGADLQQALADRRPTLDPSYSGSEQQAPLFDMGVLAKTEYVVTKKVRAGVSYRKGVNSLFSADRYTERDYLQFQLKCVIFNK